MGTLWEYTRIYASGSTTEHEREREDAGISGQRVSHAEVRKRVLAEWETALNERGLEGWELVSEHVWSDEGVQRVFVSFSGTLKRPVGFEP